MCARFHVNQNTTKGRLGARRIHRSPQPPSSRHLSRNGPAYPCKPHRAGLIQPLVSIARGSLAFIQPGRMVRILRSARFPDCSCSTRKCLCLNGGALERGDPPRILRMGGTNRSGEGLTGCCYRTWNIYYVRRLRRRRPDQNAEFPRGKRGNQFLGRISGAHRDGHLSRP